MNDEIIESYRLLEIAPNSSLEVVRNAYREMMKVWHPDRFPNDLALQSRATEKLKLVNLAFELLKKSLSESGEANTSLGAKEYEAFTPSVVDKFRYYDGFIDELDLNSGFDTLSSSPPATVKVVSLLREVFETRRNVSISVVPRLVEHNAPLRMLLSLEKRNIALAANSCSTKGIIFPLFLLYFRDALCSRKFSYFAESRLNILKHFGWSGRFSPSDSGYLKAEWKVCNLASDEVMRRLFNLDGKRGTICDSARDVLGQFRAKAGRETDEDISRYLGKGFIEDPSFREMHG